jgi:chromosome segregation ATPase
MPENETQENQENQNQAPTAEAVGEALSLDQIKAQLEEERQAKTYAEEEMQRMETTLAVAQSRIAELESALSEAKQGSEAALAETARLKDAEAATVAKYREALLAAHPDIPQDLIQGDSISDLYASVEKAKATVEAVKATMQAEAAATKVPAGAPTRGAISTEGMSPREKIAAGISRQSRE